MDFSMRKITNSLIADGGALSIDSDKPRERLCKETEKQSLRNTDLAELTGWSTSKTSKVTAGKQKMLADDVKTWSRALGFTPDPFVSDNVDLRYYQLSSYVRSVSECFDAYFDAMESDVDYFAIVNYELPLSILSLLGVTVSDYAVRTNAFYFDYDDKLKKGVGKSPTYVRFWQRTTREPETMTPEFGVWISPSNEEFLFAVYLNRNADDGAMSRLRMKWKDVLQVEQKQTEEFDEFARFHNDWVPRKVREGEIYSAGSTTNEFPDADILPSLVIDIFKKYCELVWEVKGIDLLPDKLKETKALSSFQALDILNGYGHFEYDVSEEARRREDFNCEIDTQHKSFIDALGRNYVEVVPLVPFRSGYSSGTGIMSSANAICLCPNCSAKLQYGRKAEREDMLFHLYRKHSEELEAAGVEISLAKLFDAYGL